MSFYVFFFFFQAEDGIRGKLVTGVQTCALPICLLPGTEQSPDSEGGPRRDPAHGRGKWACWAQSRDVRKLVRRRGPGTASTDEQPQRRGAGTRRLVVHR